MRRRRHSRRPSRRARRRGRAPARRQANLRWSCALCRRWYRRRRAHPLPASRRWHSLAFAHRQLVPLRESPLELFRDQIVDRARGRSGDSRQQDRQRRAFARAFTFVLRDLRRGVADRHEHREHRRWPLRFGRAHREKRVQERAMQPEIAGRDEVADVLEHGVDLRARGGIVETRERCIERRAHFEQALQDLRAEGVVGTCHRRRRRHPGDGTPWRMSGVARGGRILVIDDEPMVRATLAQVLADEGYLVDVAGDGAEPLDSVHAARPDAILLDLMMPGMNGRQFLQALRDEPAYKDVPVLIMTAVHGLEVNLASIGASEVVEKPFDVDDLLNKVALAVYRSRDAGPLANAPLASLPIEPEPAPVDRGVVLVVERDRVRLQRLDLVLSELGYTVVSMTRAMAQLSRLARALRPRAILLELSSEGIYEIVRELNAETGPLPVLVYARDGASSSGLETFERATDADLVAFVEKQR